MTLFLGVVVIFFIVTPLARALGKMRAAALLSIVSALFVVSTYCLRLLGLFPDVGSPMLLPMFLLLNTIGTAAGVGGMIIGASMMSDVVEASEEETGRREEGLFFSGALFMQKCASGLGILITGWILSAAQFPEAAVPGKVDVGALDRYTLLFIIATLALSAVSACAFLRFPFGQAEHDARIAALAVASAQKG